MNIRVGSLESNSTVCVPEVSGDVFLDEGALGGECEVYLVRAGWDGAHVTSSSSLAPELRVPGGVLGQNHRVLPMRPGGRVHCIYICLCPMIITVVYNTLL